MDGLQGTTKQQFFEMHENENDIVKVMADYRKEFNERLTTDTYQYYVYNPVMEEDEDAGEII